MLPSLVGLFDFAKGRAVTKSPSRAFFDEYVMVDWSANNSPKTGADSIWICHGKWVSPSRFDSSFTANPSTRSEAMVAIESTIRRCLASGKHLLVGFDFPFSYPVGLTRYCPTLFDQGVAPWEAIWKYLELRIQDDQYDRLNKSNRFKVADEMNRHSGFRLFWGRPEMAPHDKLGFLPVSAAVVPAQLQPNPCPNLRLTESTIGRGVKSAWQLYCGVSVGSQSLVGIPRLARLRAMFIEDLAVWPFETGLVGSRDALPKPITLAEIWPTAVPFNAQLGSVKDQAQVRSVAEGCAKRDREGTLGAWLSPLAVTSGGPAVMQRVIDEEGWILGV